MTNPLYKDAIDIRFLGYSVEQKFIMKTQKWETYVNVHCIPIDEDGNIVKPPYPGPKPFISKILIRSEDNEIEWNKFNQIIANAAVEAKKAFRELRNTFANIDQPI